jgi:hypothetical protein
MGIYARYEIDARYPMQASHMQAHYLVKTAIAAMIPAMISSERYE